MSNASRGHRPGSSAMERLLYSIGPRLSFLARPLIAALFVSSGCARVVDYAGTQAFMRSAGIPGALLPLAINQGDGGHAGPQSSPRRSTRR